MTDFGVGVDEESVASSNTPLNMFFGWAEVEPNPLPVV